MGTSLLVVCLLLEREWERWQFITVRPDSVLGRGLAGVNVMCQDWHQSMLPAPNLGPRLEYKEKQRIVID